MNTYQVTYRDPKTNDLMVVDQQAYSLIEIEQHFAIRGIKLVRIVRPAVEVIYEKGASSS